MKSAIAIATLLAGLASQPTTLRQSTPTLPAQSALRQFWSTLPAQLPTAGARSSSMRQQPAITRAHIEFFLDVSLGTDPDGRLPGWPEPARVSIGSSSLVKSDPLLDETIAELNRIAGRTLLVRSDSAPNVEVRYVSPGQFADVDFTLRSGWSRTDIEQSDSGRLEAGVVLLSAKLTGDLRRGALRRNLAQVVGLLHGSKRFSRSLFYESNTIHSATVFEPVDRALIRMLGENQELRGMSRQDVRRRLEERYLQ